MDQYAIYTVILLRNVSVSNYVLDQYVCSEVTPFKHISRYSYPVGLMDQRSIPNELSCEWTNLTPIKSTTNMKIKVNLSHTTILMYCHCNYSGSSRTAIFTIDGSRSCCVIYKRKRMLCLLWSTALHFFLNLVMIYFWMSMMLCYSCVQFGGSVLNHYWVRVLKTPSGTNYVINEHED